MKLLFGNDANYVWRSGIKHDCARVMELNSEGPNLKNGLGEYVDIEAHYLYPMLKSSDVAGEKTNRLKYMLVTQQFVGEPTGKIESTAPKTWSYLTKHMVSFELRGSSIYNGKPDFSIFGVGAYTFKPWKVAISGFYKKLNFSVIGPVAGRPVVFDDTVYFLGCESENQAVFIAGLLNSYESKVFFDSLIFWDEKRPITIELLRKLNLRTLATLFGLADEFDQYASVVRANEIPFGQLR